MIESSVCLLGPKEIEPTQKLDFEMPGSQIVDPNRILGYVAMISDQESHVEVVEPQSEVVGQLAMELRLVLPESNQL